MKKNEVFLLFLNFYKKSGVGSGHTLGGSGANIQTFLYILNSIESLYFLPHCHPFLPHFPPPIFLSSSFLPLL